MKTIDFFCGSDLEWVNSQANEFDGWINGNKIVVSPLIHTGDRYFMECSEGIVSYYVDVVYKDTIHYKVNNLKTNFFGIYYNLTESDTKLILDDEAFSVGRWKHNVSVVDSEFVLDYEVKKESESFLFMIFISKDIFRQFLKNSLFTKVEIDNVMLSISSSIQYNIMSAREFHLLNELRQLEVGDREFDLSMKATTFLLISDYLLKLSLKDDSIVSHQDPSLQFILSTQEYLIQNMDKPFPGISFLADRANMSKSKFKILFKKITGETPNIFYLNKKLAKARELLDERRFSIKEIATILDFADSSYFIKKFREYYGISPMQYVLNSPTNGSFDSNTKEE